MRCCHDYYLTQTRIIKGNFQLAYEAGSEDAIHDFRVGVKRWRAFLDLAAGIQPRFKPDRHLAVLRKAFKTAGAVRDLQVQMALVRKRGPAAISGLSEYYNHLKARELLACRDFRTAARSVDLDRLDTIGDAIGKQLQRLTPDEALVRCEQRLADSLQHLLSYRNRSDWSSEDFHQLRIHTKATRYVLEVVRLCQGDDAPLVELNDGLLLVHRALGAWRDALVAVDTLEAFKRDHADRPLHNEEQFEAFHDWLHDSVEIHLAAFETAWEQFTELLQPVDSPASPEA
jgi:CHAD domain-containing protein